MLHRKLLSVIVKHDERESKKPGYNPYGLAHMIRALHNAEEEVTNGVTIQEALNNNFCGRLLDKLLKVV
jgi:hypothetical protein